MVGSVTYVDERPSREWIVFGYSNALEIVRMRKVNNAPKFRRKYILQEHLTAFSYCLEKEVELTDFPHYVMIGYSTSLAVPNRLLNQYGLCYTQMGANDDEGARAET